MAQRAQWHNPTAVSFDRTDMLAGTSPMGALASVSKQPGSLRAGLGITAASAVALITEGALLIVYLS